MEGGAAYAKVHAVWTIPPALLLWWTFRRLRTAREVNKTLALILIAVVATIPWDSYLIKHRIWTYPASTILGPTLFLIPYEEIFFFFIQTYITSCLYAVLSRPVVHVVLLPRNDHEGRFARWTGTALLLAIMGASAKQLMTTRGEGTYLALILVWVTPFLALLWNIASQHIVAMPLYASVLPIILPTMYLWILDSVALQRGTWVIESGTKLGIALCGLEIEEAIFFFLTNVLIVCGLIACDMSLAIHDADPFAYPLPRSSGFPSVASVLRSVTASPSSYPLDHLSHLQAAITLLHVKSKSFYTASMVFEGKLKLDLLSLYSFCRVCDDLIDEAPTSDDAAKNIDIIARYLDLVLPTKEQSALSSPSSQREVRDLLAALPPSARPAFSLLPSIAIPRNPLDELLAGFKTDLAFSASPPAVPIRSDEDLLLYASQVASSVAELCVHVVWSNEGYGDAKTPAERAEVIAAAREMGAALQLVNIARDVPADRKNGRMYLPGFSLDASLESMSAERLRLLDVAGAMARRSAPAIAKLPRTAAGGIRAATLVYLKIGNAVRKAIQAGDIEGRATVSQWRRTWTAWKALETK